MKHLPRSHRHCCIALALVAGTSLTFAPRASAQSAISAPAEAAHRAQTAYDVQDWATAIKEYRAAYQAEQRPEYLWGLAQSLRMSGDCKSAMLSYKAYRRAEVTSNQATAAELMITRCEAEIAKRDAEATKAASAAEPPPPVAAEPPKSEPRAAAPERAAAPPAARPEPKRFYEDALGDVLFVAGAAAAGTGGYFLLKGNSQVQDGNGAATYGDHTGAVDDGKRKQTVGAVVLGAGGALLVAATWRFLTFDTGAKDQVSVGLGGIDFRTRF